MKTQNTSQAPVIYIKLNPYLKEFLLHLEDAKGERLYPKEPIHFASKTRLRILVDRFRRVPSSSYKIFIPKTREEKRRSLAIQLDIDENIKGDKYRTYIGEDSQCKIAKYIYNEMMTCAVEYIKEDLNLQRHLFPKNTPSLRSAYRSFFDAYGIESMDEDTLRKALERRNELLPFQEVKKKFDQRVNFLPFSAHYLPLSAQDVPNVGQSLKKTI